VVLWLIFLVGVLNAKIWILPRLFPANVTDETRAGECGVSPFEKQKMLSGVGAYDLGTSRALFSGGLVSLWFQGRAFFSPRAFYLRRSRSAFQAWRDLHEFRHEPL